jgi:hypothetical protein
MRTAALVTLLALLAAGRVDARLGESQAEIEKRYGPPFRKLKFQKPIEKRFSYRFSGYAIEVSFIEDRSVLELIERDDRGFFADDEVAAFLRANEVGLSWRREESENTERVYRRADGKAVARLNAYMTKFMIATSDSGTPSEKRDGKVSRKSLEGF